MERVSEHHDVAACSTSTAPSNSNPGARPFVEGLSSLEGDEISLDFAGSSIPLHPTAPWAAEHVRRYQRPRHEPEAEDYFFHKHVWLRWWWDSLLFKLRSFLSVTFTLHTMFSVAMSVGATVFCDHFKLSTDMPLSLLATALFFPLSFGIGFNLSRREAMLKDVGNLRALLLGLFWAARDWIEVSGEGAQSPLPKVKKVLETLLLCIRQTMLHNTPPGGSSNVYRAFDDLALVMHEVAVSDPKFYRSGMDSRWQQFFKQALETFERIRVNHDYRTPSSLRAYALVYLSLLSFFLAPLFANYSRQFGLAAGCYIAVLSSLLFVGLYRIYANEEDPLDGTGPDDLSLEGLARLPELMHTRRHLHHIHILNPSDKLRKPFKGGGGGTRSATVLSSEPIETSPRSSSAPTADELEERALNLHMSSPKLTLPSLPWQPMSRKDRTFVDLRATCGEESEAL